MSRQLKFRAWQASQKKMHQEVGLHPHIMTNHTMCDEDESDYVAEGTGKGEWTLFSNSCEWPIMQFTGLKDKNGKEIYEGDIIKWGHLSGSYENPTRVAVVEIKPDIRFRLTNGKHIFHFGNFTYSSCTDKVLEVIGNIYENPDLL